MRKNPRNGALNSELMQRIDNMKDSLDYDPYKPVKKKNLSNKELFNEEDYVDVDKEDEEMANRSLAISLFFIGLVFLFVFVSAYLYLR